MDRRAVGLCAANSNLYSTHRAPVLCPAKPSADEYDVDQEAKVQHVGQELHGAVFGSTEEAEDSKVKLDTGTKAGRSSFQNKRSCKKDKPTSYGVCIMAESYRSLYVIVPTA